MTVMPPLTRLSRALRLPRLFNRARALLSRNVPLIDESLWRSATRDYTFIRSLSAEENRRLRLIASDFLSRKIITGAGGLEIDERIRVQVAAQACILVLELGMRHFEGWKEVIVYPAAFMREREYTDEFGVVHSTRDPLAGEAWLDGPVVLSYDDVAKSGSDSMHGFGHNVVIHEFAHKLDMRNGPANGFPRLQRGMTREGWRRAFMGTYLDFCRRVDEAEARQHLDHGAALDALPLDPYAAENPAEFFAVISEAFFEMPENVAEDFPAVYEQLTKFYRQNPATRALH